MHRFTRVMAVTASLLFATTAAAAAQSSNGSGGDRSVVDGAYTAEQADAGEKMFMSTCANCHPSSQFRGAAFRKVWAGRPVYLFFDQLRTMMPMDNPGGLSGDEYAAVVAYILKLNGWPAGDAELPAQDSALRRIRFGPASDGDAYPARARARDRTTSRTDAHLDPNDR